MVSKITVLGASNSILKNGYVPRLEHALAKQGIAAKVNNVSIGASYCLRGLSTVVSEEAKSSDFFILEFSITDTPYIAKVGEEIWLQSYEGLIRNILLKFPNASIVVLVLGRADRTVFKWQRIMRKGIRLLSNKYNIDVVDFDKLLHNLLPDYNEFKSMYSDKLHYAAPLAPSLCANVIAKKIKSSIKSKKSSERRVLLNENHPLDQVKVINFSEYDKCSNLPKTRFKNSRYDVEVVKLGLEDKIVLPENIIPIGIEFVSTGDSSTLQIARESSNSVVHTFHKGLNDKRFSFLLRFSHLQDCLWDQSNNFGCSITLSNEKDFVSSVPKSGMIFNKFGTNAYLKTMIYV